MTEQWLRDADGVMVPVAQAREAIRDVFEVSGDEQLLENAAGRIHPDQVPLVQAHVRTQTGIAWFLVGLPILVVGGCSLAAAAAWPESGGAAVMVGVLVCGVLAMIGVLWTGSIQRTRLETVRGLVTAERIHAGRPTLVDGVAVPVPEHWIGQPVVVHLIRSGASGPLMLSGDLEVDRVRTVSPPEPTSSSRPTRVGMPGASIHVPSRFRSPSRTITFVDEPDGETVLRVVNTKGRTWLYPLHTLEEIGYRGTLDGPETSWNFRFEPGSLSVRGVPGRHLSSLIRQHRPELTVVRYGGGGEVGGGGGGGDGGG